MKQLIPDAVRFIVAGLVRQNPELPRSLDQEIDRRRKLVSAGGASPASTFSTRPLA